MSVLKFTLSVFSWIGSFVNFSEFEYMCGTLEWFRWNCWISGRKFFGSSFEFSLISVFCINFGSELPISWSATVSRNGFYNFIFWILVFLRIQNAVFCSVHPFFTEKNTFDVFDGCCMEMNPFVVNCNERNYQKSPDFHQLRALLSNIVGFVC